MIGAKEAENINILKKSLAVEKSWTRVWVNHRKSMAIHGIGKNNPSRLSL